ncbi:tRNA-specific adenosine deaminase-like protein 3 [Gryllus bimaculatus]|nr:tRNA-specific adenosine deaminase-like protein 3 [Gryllus bimaculatus]
MSDTTSYDAANESDGWHIEAVLGPEYSEPVRTVDAVVDVVVDRRHTSRLVQDLQRLCPIPSLRHLKRVCPDGRILIQLATDSPGHEGSDSDKNSSRTSKCSPLPQECKNKRSFSETVTDSDSGPQDGSTSSEQLYSTSKSVLLDEQKNESAAAAVHPHDGSLVALAVDARDEHPLQHAAMRLVDLVARTQCGGVWTPLPKEEIKESVSNASGKDSLPYLCTGLDVVMTHEPCAMCAMALTHARTRCVFFSEDNSNCGVLYSHSPPLQILPGLNHRLQVFHAYLPEGKR